MQWVKFSERWPVLPGNIGEYPESVIVRGPSLKQNREAQFMQFAGVWRLSDCTHPMQNCYFSWEEAEWLED